MSSLTASDLQELWIDHYIKLSSFTILIYEFCLTFTHEVELFWWTNKATWATFFFFLNRYFVLLSYVPIMVMEFWYSRADSKQSICRGLRSYYQYNSVAVQVVISAILIMRTYALYNRSRRVLVLMILIVLAVAIVACWSIVSELTLGRNGFKYSDVMGCQSPISRARALGLVKAWAGLLVFDTLIFILTVHKSLSLDICGPRPSLLTLMLRDGSIYFGVMVASNLANILTYVYGGVCDR